jgi:hypothetical protein
MKSAVWEEGTRAACLAAVNKDGGRQETRWIRTRHAQRDIRPPTHAAALAAKLLQAGSIKD